MKKKYNKILQTCINFLQCVLVHVCVNIIIILYYLKAFICQFMLHDLIIKHV
jgi:hypothetical protein